VSVLRPARLDGRVFVVTGASQGMGEAIARGRRQRAGAAGLCLGGRDPARGARVAAALAAAGCPAEFVAGDLADAPACGALMAAAERRFGRLDGLVNAAGISDRGTLDDTSVALWDRVFAVNVRAPFILTQALARHLARDGRPGAVVNIVTRSSHGGQPFLVAYSASKGALANLTRNTAHGLRDRRIRVNGINLGWADTPGEHAIQARRRQAGRLAGGGRGGAAVRPADQA